MMYPPMVAPTSPKFPSSRVPTITGVAPVTEAGAPVRLPGVKVPHTDPWNSFPPDLVTALIAPPLVRPYSGMYPPLTTLISSMNSAVRGEPSVPNPGLFTESPSMRYRFSGEVAPLMPTP
jgi:hypothetical protein